MSKTKNVALGMIAVFMTIYMTLIGMNFYITQVNKLQLERVFPRSVEHALKEGMETGNASSVENILQEEIEASISDVDDIQVEIRALDLEKGILSAKATVTYTLLSGEEETAVVEKTMIMERQIPKESRVTVTFLVEEEVYKEYQLVQGENCPMPEIPSNHYVGWMEYGSASNKIIQSIGSVWSDKVYIAVTR